VRTKVNRFIARWDYLYQSKAVLATETSPDVWAITTWPGVSVIDGGLKPDHIFYGGRKYMVDGALANALALAGYTVSGPGFDSGFSGGFTI
jgi:hypothetical protein